MYFIFQEAVLKVLVLALKPTILVKNKMYFIFQEVVLLECKLTVLVKNKMYFIFQEVVVKVLLLVT